MKGCPIEEALGGFGRMQEQRDWIQGRKALHYGVLS
jgi:hypothetical protein